MAYPVLDSLIRKAARYAPNLQVEKVYAHFDRSTYFKGEIAWYKVYVIDDAPELTPSKRIKTVFFDWIAPDGTLLEHQILRCQSGRANSNFEFKDLYPEGVYTVRVYTDWIRNYDSLINFTSTITVLDPKVRRPSIERPSSEIDLQFFPEGGSMIVGLQSQVAFKAINQDGLSVRIDGALYNDLNEFQTNITTTHNGMGSIPLSPQPNRSYYVQLSNGKRFPLPPALQQGWLLNISNRNENFVLARITATRTPRSAAFLIATSQGRVHYAGAISFNGNIANVSIPKSSLPSGITQLTLFDSNGNPVCERMIFVLAMQTRPKITVTSNKTKMLPRDSITLTVKLSNLVGDQLQGDLSASVINSEFAATAGRSSNIFTQLLLQSELKGLIEDPQWYFDSASGDRQYSLDLLMMTQGWRRYPWNTVLSIERPPNRIDNVNGITLKGKVTVKGQPLANSQLMLLVPDSVGNNKSELIPTDSLGRFHADGFDIVAGSKIIWWALNAKGTVNNPKMELDTTFNIPRSSKMSKGLAWYFWNRSNPTAISGALDKTHWLPSATSILDEVVIEGARIPIQTTYGGAMMVSPDSKDLSSRISTSQFVSRYAPQYSFMQVRKSPGGMDVWGSETKGQFVPLEAIMIDGEFKETNGAAGNPLLILNSIPIEQVDRVIVSRRTVAIWTKAAKSSPSHQTIQVSAGYNISKEFYHPKYGPNDATLSQTDDRITLSWNPDLHIDKEGIITIKFFNSDRAPGLLLDLQGIVNGHPLSIQKTIE